MCKGQVTTLPAGRAQALCRNCRMGTIRGRAALHSDSAEVLEDRWRELVAGGASEDEATKLALAGFRQGICSHDTSRHCGRRRRLPQSRREHRPDG